MARYIDAETSEIIGKVYDKNKNLEKENRRLKAKLEETIKFIEYVNTNYSSYMPKEYFDRFEKLNIEGGQ